MLFAFVCRTCGSDLTDFLSEEAPAALEFVIGDTVVKPGRFVRIMVAMTRQELYRMKFAGSEGSVVVVQSGDYLLNVADLRHQMHPRANFGCCRYQGGAEANALCPNGHPVATIHSDCWHPSVARVIADLVECIAA
jgi:hypothetical protein